MNWDSLMQEIWKPITGYEGLYSVSNKGRIRSLTRKIPTRLGSARTMIVRGRIMRCEPQAATYRQVRLCRDGKCKTRTIHTLVAASFIGEHGAGKQVRHLDGDPLNCCVSNLCYGTQLQNNQDKIRHGTSNRGQRNARSKLTETQVREIRKLKKQGWKRSQLARAFGLAPASIQSITSRRNWGWLSDWT